MGASIVPRRDAAAVFGTFSWHHHNASFHSFVWGPIFCCLCVRKTADDIAAVGKEGSVLMVFAYFPGYLQNADREKRGAFKKTFQLVASGLPCSDDVFILAQTQWQGNDCLATYSSINAYVPCLQMQSLN